MQVNAVPAMPFAAKLWFVGYVVLYGAAKIHTSLTVDSGHFLERHWPFWAAMIIWSGVFALGCAVAERRKDRSSGRRPEEP